MRTESGLPNQGYFALRLFAAACALTGALAVDAAELHVKVLDASERPVTDAVVIAVPVDSLPSTPSAADHARVAAMDQVDKQFNPFVLVIAAGTDVDFPNHDRVHHHVYSFSPAKHFELPLYGSDQKNIVRFDQPGIVVLGCNIHDWMIGYIYVAETPYFARTDASGAATLANLPDGAYTVRIWHPAMKASEHGTERRVDVGASIAPAEQAWRIALAAAAPQRRAPLPGLHGY